MRCREADDDLFLEGNSLHSRDRDKSDSLLHHHKPVGSGSDTQQSHANAVSTYACAEPGCELRFSSRSAAEQHYDCTHRCVCETCSDVFSDDRILRIHVEEEHSSLFSVMAESADMYECLVAACAKKFRTASGRRHHVINAHGFPHSFRFGHADTDAPPRRSGIACRHFLAEGGCKFGAACRFIHDKSGSVASASTMDGMDVDAALAVALGGLDMRAPDTISFGHRGRGRLPR